MSHHRHNYTAEASTAIMVMVERLLKAYKDGSPPPALARQLEIAIVAQQNELLEGLAVSIASHDGLEESSPVLAALSRGDPRTIVVNICYAARQTFAGMARDYKQPVDVLPGRPFRARQGMEPSIGQKSSGACHLLVDKSFEKPVEGSRDEEDEDEPIEDEPGGEPR